MRDERASTQERRNESLAGVEDRWGPATVVSRIKTFEALRYRDFRYLWLGQVSNSASLWMEQVARPILVLALTGSMVHLGLVFAARMVPQLTFGVIAGVIADAYDRRMIMLISKATAMVANFLFALLILSGNVELWHVYLTTVIKGTAHAFDNPARQALIPSLVPPHGLTNAVSLNTASMQLMRVGGAFFAGLSLVAWGIGGTFLGVAVIYLGAVTFTYLMKTPPQATVRADSLRGAIGSLREGFVYAWSEPVIRGLLLLMMAYFALGMAYMQVFAPALATQVMGIGDSGFGFLMSASGAGALVGALVVATWSPMRHRGAAMLVMLSLLGVLLVVFALSTYLHLVALAFIAIAFVGLFQAPFFALVNTALLQITPEDKRGRIMGILSMDRSMIVLGGAMGGFLAAGVGPQLAQILFGLGLVFLALMAALLMPSLRRF